jgi:hypothetical protein
MSNVEDNHKALHSSDPGECTSASMISILSLSAQVVPGQQEGQVVTPDVEVRIQDLACEQQGWNEGDVEEPIVSAVDSFSKHQAPNNITDMQDKNADVQIPDSRQSASIRAISS